MFLISIRKDIDLGLFEWPETEELKTRLLDYLEDEVDEKYFLSDKQVKGIQESTFQTNARRIHDPNGIIGTLCARDYKDPKCVDLSLIQVGQMYGTEKEPNPQAGRIYDPAGLSPTLDSMQGGNRMPKIIIPENTKKGYAEAEEGDGVYIDRPHQKRGVVQKGLIQTIKTSGSDVGVVVKDTRNLKERLADDLIVSGTVKGGEVINHSYTSSKQRPELKDFIETDTGIMPTLTTRPDTLGVVVGGAIRNRPDENGKNKPNLELRKDSLSNALTTFDKDNIVVVGEFRRDEGLRTFKDDVIGTLRTKDAGGDKVVVSHPPLRIRKLTPKECWRLMGFDDEDHDAVESAGISNSQRYKMAGNSIVVNVAEKILKNLIEQVL